MSRLYLGRRSFLGYIAAALAAPFLPKAATGDGITLKNIPHPPFLDDNLILHIKEWRPWIGYAAAWDTSDGEVGYRFSDGSELRLPSPAVDILRDIRIRAGEQTSFAYSGSSHVFGDGASRRVNWGRW